MSADASTDASPADGFEPANELERVLARCLLTGARARLLRALARSTVCVPAGVPGRLGRSEADAGPLHVPCVVDGGGRHATVYTSYRQLALAHGGRGPRADLPWYEVPVAALFDRWPADVDVWLNAGGEIGFPLDGRDITTITEIAAGREVEEAYEVGPDDRFTDFPGPLVPDQVDCAVVVALLDSPEVLEVFRAFRTLDEPQGRTWRVILVFTDGGGRHGERLAHLVARAVNDAADECCEVHVADIHDDEVYDAVAPVMSLGVPLWRRDGFLVPDTLEGLDQLDVGPDEPAS